MIVDRTIHIAHVGAFGINHSPWVHLNLLDISPPGHDLMAVLHDPKGRNARISAWADALARYDKGLLYVKGLRKGKPLSGVSIEGEQIVPVPHDMSMVHPKDTPHGRAIAIEKVLRTIAVVMGVDRVIPYGSAQVLPATIVPKRDEHLYSMGRWYNWHRSDYGPMRNIPPCQSIYQKNIGAMELEGVQCTLDRHAASGRISKSKPLTVFFAPTDARADPFLVGVFSHPLPCRLVSWHKCDTIDAARAGADAVCRVADTIELQLGCSLTPSHQDTP